MAIWNLETLFPGKAVGGITPAAFLLDRGRASRTIRSFSPELCSRPENYGAPLGPAHGNFADIGKLSHGRVSCWTGQGFGFSTGDGSDPNSNGRRYWAVVP